MKTFALSILLFLLIQFTFAQNIDNTLITGTYNNIPLTTFLDDLTNRYTINFFYDETEFQKTTVNQNFTNAPLREVLDKVLKEMPYVYDILQNNVVFMHKEKVATFAGNKSFSKTENIDQNTKIIGNQSDIGKYSQCSLSGKIKGGKLNEPLFGVVVQVANSKIITSTDAEGNYSLKLAPGVYSIGFSSVGYENITTKVKVIGNGTMDILLPEESINVNEVVILSRKANKNVAGNQMSIVELDKQFIKQLPTSLGTRDIIKSMTMIPGVKSVGEFGSDINVRGGGNDQNLVLIEGAPIFNTSHILGLLSVINADAVSNVTLYKGDIPVKFGERASSVMDIELKADTAPRFKSYGGIGLIDSRLTIEVPLVKNKATLLIGGRTTYSDWILRQLPDLNLRNSSARFYDLNVLLSVNYNLHNKFIFFHYRSNDVFHYAKELDYEYGNNLGSIKWIHTFNSRLFANLQLAFSNYDITKNDTKVEFEQSKKQSGIHYTTAKLNFTWASAGKHTADWGLQAINYSVNPGTLSPLDSKSIVVPLSINKEQSAELAGYISDKFEINKQFSLTAGLRYSMYFNYGETTVYQYKDGESKSEKTIADTVTYSKNKIVKSYTNFEPRLSFKYQLNKESSFKISYSRTSQYVQLISYTSISTPDDLWKLSDQYLKPVACNLFAVGYFHNFMQNKIETSIELYYKRFTNLVEYKNGSEISMNKHIETIFIDAEGKNYGVEIFLKKNFGKLDGWLSYTYSRSLKKTLGVYNNEKINNNAWYASNFDKPHDLTTSLTYHFTRRWRASANFTLSTGRAITLPEMQYFTGKDWAIVYSDRNKYYLPNYHRLDVSVSLDESLRIKKRWKGSWTLSLVNVYGRKNVYSVFYKKDESNNSFSLYQLSIIGRPIPTLTYNFVF